MKLIVTTRLIIWRKGLGKNSFGKKSGGWKIFFYYYSNFNEKWDVNVHFLTETRIFIIEHIKNTMEKIIEQVKSDHLSEVMIVKSWSK